MKVYSRQHWLVCRLLIFFKINFLKNSSSKTISVWIQTVCNGLQTTLACLSSADFSKINFYEKCSHEYHQSVKQFGSRSGLTFFWGLIWIQTVCKGLQQTTLACLSSADFFKISFFEKFFQEYHQSVKQF